MDKLYTNLSIYYLNEIYCKYKEINEYIYIWYTYGSMILCQTCREQFKTYFMNILAIYSLVTLSHIPQNEISLRVQTVRMESTLVQN